ncbi:MAG: hypothetical protein ACYCZF_11880 [Anaerolineae bacterium]
MNDEPLQKHQMGRRLTRTGWLVLFTLTVIIIMAGCLSDVDRSPETAVDYTILETEVAGKLRMTLTAKAPTLTPIPSDTPRPPTPTPSPTPTRAPFVTGEGPFLAFVRVMQENSENIILRSGERSEAVLSRFVEQRSVGDLAWSADGQWLIFMSAHNYLYSRNNERNVFVMRPYGSQLRMITGEYDDPSKSTGPFITLKGVITGSEGPCLVGAQGAASAATTNPDGTFELPGVPVTSQWIRAVCNQSDIPRQADISLDLAHDVTSSITITVEARGQGWTRVDLSPDNCLFAGLFYQWHLDDEEQRVLTTSGRLYDMKGVLVAELPLPEGTTLSGLAWSPRGDQLVGTLEGEKAIWLWLWDRQGVSLGSMLETPNPDGIIYSVNDPIWSYDGAMIAFTLQSLYWWGDTQYKTEIAIYNLASSEMRTRVASEWGTHAVHPAWSADGQRIYYQLFTGQPGEDPATLVGGQIWWISEAGGDPTQVTKDGINILPALRPVDTIRTTNSIDCLEP